MMKLLTLLATLQMSQFGFAQSVDPIMDPTLSPIPVLETIKMDTIYSWRNNMPGPEPMTHGREHSVIKFSALSNGCTDENSFEVLVTLDHLTGAQILSVIRVKPDLCKGVSQWVDIDLSLKNPLAWFIPVKVANPFPATFDIVW